MLVGLVVLGAACSSDDTADSTEASVSAPSIVLDPGTGELQPLVETGTFTVTVEAADGTSPITVADRLDQVLSKYPGAKRASVDGSIVTAVVTDFPRADSLTFDFTMRQEPIVAVHPVFACAEAGEVLAPVPGGDLLLSGETVGQCALGPSQFERVPFTEAFVLLTLDIQVSVDIDPEQIDEFNALTQSCFEGSETCPSKQIAVVVDEEILTAPTVNIAEFPTTLALTGNFTEEQANELADAIAMDRFTGEFVSAQYDYLADA